MAGVSVLTLPGYGSSGPDHWQSLWEERYGYRRVEQDDWLEPDADEWVKTLDRAVDVAGGPVVLVAHSLGCALAVRWAVRGRGDRVAGALLVAPADVDSPAHTPDEVRGFAPLPAVALPFPAIVVASDDDPFMDVARARALAAAWGARWVGVGALGHVNAASGIGDWPAGHRLLDELRAAAR